MLVQKFGGTSLADLKGFQASSKVVKRFAANEPLVAVFSAVAGVTDLLVAAIDPAEAGEDFTTSLQFAIEREQSVLEESSPQLTVKPAERARQRRGTSENANRGICPSCRPCAWPSEGQS